MQPRLSVVIPFRDESESLAALYAELDGVLSALDLSCEMIFVDDASRDEGQARLLAAAGGDPRVRVLSLSPHSGQSAALEAGFDRARGEVIATLDADLQNDPADLPRLLSALDGADCVNGVRTPRLDGPTKRIASRVANAIRRRVLGDEVRDIGCSIRVMRAEPLRRVKLFRGSHRFLPVLLALEGARVVELPVRHRPRRHGRSKYGIGGRLAQTWVDLLAVLWMTRRVTRYEVKELNRRA
jgi:dolichol-phosphate mannosyltransferase